MLAGEVPLGHDGSPKRGVIVSAYVRRAMPCRLAEACEVMARLYRLLTASSPSSISPPGGAGPSGPPSIREVDD